MSQLGIIQSGSGSLFVQTLTGNIGGAVPPTAGNIDILGSGVVLVTGNPGTSTLTISVSGTVADLFDEDSGSAAPIAGVLNVIGGTSVGGVATNINTIGSGNTVFVCLNNNINQPNTNGAGTAGIYEYNGTRWIQNFGTRNGFLGPNAGNLTLSGTDNWMFGSVAGAALTSGSNNIGIGTSANLFVTTGSHNIGIGGLTNGSTTGSANIAIGHSSMVASQTGSENVAIGSFTFSGANGSNNICIGSNAGISYTGTESANILLNSNGVLGESNTLRIGFATGAVGQDLVAAYISGIYSKTVGATNGLVLVDNADKLGFIQPTNGQLPIGSTGTSPVFATLSAGTNISITNGAGSITIAGTGAASFTWSVITVNQTAAINNGYICNKASTLALALPAVSPVGSIIEVTGINTALGWQLTQAAGQQIFFGTTQTTSGATGTLTSSQIRDSVRIVCVVANLTWNVISSVGNLTVA